MRISPPNELVPTHNYFLMIPAPIADDPDLDDSTKMLFGRIASLSNQKGFCWASDRHLAEVCNCQIRVIQIRLKVLEDKGYIQRITKKNGVLWDRKIIPNFNPIQINSKKNYEAHADAIRIAQPCYSNSTGVRQNKISNNNISNKQQQQTSSASSVAVFLLRRIISMNA